MERLVLPIVIICVAGVLLTIGFGWLLGQFAEEPSMVKFLLLIIIGAPAAYIGSAFLRAG